MFTKPCPPMHSTAGLRPFPGTLNVATHRHPMTKTKLSVPVGLHKI